MGIENEVKDLQETGLFKVVSGFLRRGEYLDFHLWLSYAEAMRNTEFREVRDYAESYEVIRG